MSTEINDLVTAAIQKYAADLPNPEFRLNLLAAAEDMGPKLIETLGLKQEWAVLTFDKRWDGPEYSADHPFEGGTYTEVLGEVDHDSENRDQVYNELEAQRERYGLDGAYTRNAVGTRMFTDYAEEEVIILTPEEQHQMDIDQGVVSG